MAKPNDDSASEPRRSCLDEQEIVDFATGLLPAENLPGVEEHLSTCDKCTELVAAAAPLIGSSSQVTQSLDGQPFGPQGISSQPTTPNSGRSGSRDRPLLAPGTPLDNTYQVVRFLGRGGMGDVYEVKHARLAGRYAAKLLSSDLADNAQAFSRFQREALIASGLSHPNIVNVIDFCHLSDGLPCLVMEFLDGVDLAQVLALGQMSLMRTLRLVRQIVSALSTLHGHQIIHRDLKPQNIFVLPEHDGEPERVKLVDFGLAKRSNPSMIVTHDRTLLGTPQYMAPEQALGSAENVGPEADQFSLAAIVYEMLAGRHPFGGDVLSTVLYRIVHEPPTPLASLSPHVPVHVIAAIERGLAKDRQARFPSVKAFLQALEGQGAAMEPAPPVTQKVHRSWYIRREVLASAGVLAVAAGVAGVVRMTRQPPDPPARRASQGPGAAAGSDPTKLAPGATGRAPSPADNLTIEPAGTAPPAALPRAAVNVPAEAPARTVRETPPSPPAAREENAGDKKMPPRATAHKKPAVASEPSPQPVAAKPTGERTVPRRHSATRPGAATRSPAHDPGHPVMRTGTRPLTWLLAMVCLAALGSCRRVTIISFYADMPAPRTDSLIINLHGFGMKRSVQLGGMDEQLGLYDVHGDPIYISAFGCAAATDGSDYITSINMMNGLPPPIAYSIRSDAVLVHMVAYPANPGIPCPKVEQDGSVSGEPNDAGGATGTGSGGSSAGGAAGAGSGGMSGSGGTDGGVDAAGGAGGTDAGAGSGGNTGVGGCDDAGHTEIDAGACQAPDPSMAQPPRTSPQTIRAWLIAPESSAPATAAPCSAQAPTPMSPPASAIARWRRCRRGRPATAATRSAAGHTIS